MSGLCNPLSPDAQKVLVRVPLVSPYAFQWILANNPRDDIGDNVIFVHEPRAVDLGLNGAVIHTGTERLAQNPPLGKWHHVQIDVPGELATAADTEPPEPPEVQSTGNRSTLLKARITLDLGTARQRQFDFDIGAGVEFDVACYAVSRVEVLIPDPRVAIDNAPPPEGQAGPFQLSTVLTTTIYWQLYGRSPIQPLTYTVPAVAAEGTLFVPRQPTAVAITGGIDAVAAAAGEVVVDFLYVPDGFRQAQYSAPASFFVLDQVAIPAGSSRFPRTVIPGNANAFRVRFEGGAATQASLIQVLSP